MSLLHFTPNSYYIFHISPLSQKSDNMPFI